MTDFIDDFQEAYFLYLNDLLKVVRTQTDIMPFSLKLDVKLNSCAVHQDLIGLES
jgi:hypothetical protein